MCVTCSGRYARSLAERAEVLDLTGRYDRARPRHASSADLVRRAVDAGTAERPIATPAEVRRMLALDRVVVA